MAGTYKYHTKIYLTERRGLKASTALQIKQKGGCWQVRVGLLLSPCWKLNVCWNLSLVQRLSRKFRRTCLTFSSVLYSHLPKHLEVPLMIEYMGGMPHWLPCGEFSADQALSFFIIEANSSKEIWPSPLASTCLTMSFTASSLRVLPKLRISLISDAEM